MIINRKAWHHQVYNFTYWYDLPPRQTNLCQYVRRVVLMGPIMGATAILLISMLAVGVSFMYLFGPIFGWRPKSWIKPWTILDTDGMVKYPGVKLGSSYNAFQLYPWHIILAALIVGVHWLLYHFVGGHVLLTEGKVLGFFILLVALIVGFFFYYGTSDTGKIISQYLAAKKQRVCPVVEFKGEDLKT